MKKEKESYFYSASCRKTRAILFALVLISAMIPTLVGNVSANTGGPDLFGYTWIDSVGPSPLVSYNWIEINTTGVDSGVTGDDEFGGPFPIGFTFNYYGNGYNDLYFNTNGLITFGSGTGALSNTQIPSTSAPDDFISPFWDDLAVGSLYNSGVIYYEQLGTAPNRQFVVEWWNITTLGGNGPMTFEVILNETGEIWIQYETIGTASSGSATVGIENFDGTDGLEYSYNTPGTIFDNLAIMFSLPPYGVSLTPEFRNGFGDLGATLSYNLTVVNMGSNDDTYDLAALGNSWVTEIYDVSGTIIITSISVIRGQYENITVKVSIPGGANLGDFDLAQITATSQNDPGTSDSALLNTTCFLIPTNVAIFKNADPWGYASIQEVLTSHSIPYDEYTSSDIGVVDLSSYDKVIIPSDQPQAFYDVFEANLGWFESYVDGGGILQFSAGSNGWNGGTLTNLPGGYSKVYDSDGLVTINLPSHPFASLPNSITDSELDGWSSSTHAYFDVLPPNAVTVCTDSNGPCLVESTSGLGRYFAYGLIVEWGWGRGYSTILENIILSMYGWATFPDYGVDLIPKFQNYFNSPGANVDYVLTATNIGINNDTYDLSYTGTWPITFRDIGDTTDITSIYVESGNSEDFIARVSIPGGASPGDIDNAIINATSQGDSNESDDAQVSTQVPFLAGWFDGFEGGLNGWRIEVLTQSSPSDTTWESGDPLGFGPGIAYNGTYCSGTNLHSDYYPDADIVLVTPYVELGAGAMILSFYNWYEMETSGDDGGFIEISENGGAWNQIWPMGGYPWPGGFMGGYTTDGYSGTATVWEKEKFDLSAYSGQVVQARFHFAASNWWGWQWGWYVDDVYIGAPPPYEMDLLPDDQLNYGFAGGFVDYILTVNNTGLNDDTYDISVSGSIWPMTFRDIADTMDISSIFVASGTSEDFIARVSIPGGASPGDMDSPMITATSQNDSNVWDDVFIKTQVPYITAWSDGFESGWGAWSYEEFSQSNPSSTIWEFGDPFGWGPGTAYSGGSCSATNIMDVYYPGADIALVSPYIQIGSAPQQLSFYTWYDMDTGGDDGGFVEISVNGGPWNQIWPIDGYPVTSGYIGGYNTDCYSGQSTGWEYEEFDLGIYAGQVVRARFHFAASDWWGWQWGWYLDEIYMGPPPPYRFELLPVFNSSFGSIGSTVDYILSINNSGTENDTYDLSSTNIWPIVFRDLGDTTDITSIYVLAGTEEKFIARVTIPGGASPGDFDLADINASSQGDLTKWHIVQIRTGVSLSPPWLEDFEFGLFGGSTGINWTTTDPTYSDVSSDTAQSGIYSMYTCGGVVTVTSIPIDLSGLASAEVRCWIQRGSDTFSEDPDGGEDLVIEYKNNVDLWIQLDIHLGSGTPGEIVIPIYSLPPDALHSQFQLRFTQTGGSGGGMDYWHLDDIYIGPPLGDITPPSDIIDLSVFSTTSSTATLTWTAPGDDGATGTASGYEVRYSLSGAITQINWGSATIFTQSWVPLSGGSTETRDVTGLASGTQYWFAIRTRDEVPNWSNVSNSPSGTTTLPSDLTPPADITDLTVWDITSDTIALMWTATGDDGVVGTATSYEVRYSTVGPITDANWGTATVFPQSWTPLPTGNIEIYNITGLAPATQYWFAIRAADEEPNWSNVSNSPSGTTLSLDITPPDIISDLVVISMAGNFVTLTWTAPGDDGNVGTAAGYEVRYSTAGIINDTNWDSAMVFTQSWTPQLAGNIEIYNITSLTSGTLYWFAIKACDEIPNWAGCSNSPNATTTLDDLAPQISNIRVNSQTLVTVAPGTVVTLTATVNDTAMGNSIVSGANYTRGAANWPGTTMNAVDGTFDLPSESVRITIDTTGWSAGNHRLYVYGWDNFSNYNTTTTLYATVRIDASPPTSSVDEIIPYWHNTAPVTITATASDSESSVQDVRLYYSFSADMVSWSGWITAGTDFTEPWQWYFSFPYNDGYYRFRTIAGDTVGNQESKSGFDTECGYDTLSPTCTANALTSYWFTTTQMTITAQANDDLSGLNDVELFYRYSLNNRTWSSWTSIGSALSTPWEWEFNLPEGEGYYQFYTQATDNACNSESGTSVEIRCAYDETQPVADAGSNTQVTEGTQVTFDASDSWDNIQIQSYEWTFVDETSQVLSGANPTYTFDTPGSYEVTLRVTDLAGNWDSHIIWVNVSSVDIPTTGSISGLVRDRDQNPLENAIVSIVGTPYYTQTDSAGHYTLDSVPQGTYDLIVTKEGFEGTTLSGIGVTAGQETANQDFILPRASEEPKPSPFDFWWVIVLAAVILLVLLILVMALKKKREQKDVGEHPTYNYPIETPGAQPQQKEGYPAFVTPPIPGQMASPPPPPDYNNGVKASDSEEEKQ